MENLPTVNGSGRGKGPADRLFFLDRLRVLTILLVFLFHVAKIFDYHPTGVHNPVPSAFWSAFREFNFLWIMPLFFAISGASVALALKPGRTGAYVRSRFGRLLVPLLVVGTFLINPLYVYAERLSSGQAATGFFQWYPQYFQGLWGFGGNFAPLGHGTHLWYLEFLFLYSLLLLPLFIRSKKRIAAGLPTWSRRFESPWALLLLFIPVSATGAGFELLGLGGMRVMGGWDPVAYLLFFGLGYILLANSRILETVADHGPAFLSAGVVLSLIHVDAHFGFNLVIPGVTRHDLAAGGALRPLDPTGWAAVQAFRGLIGWCWVIGLLGTGARLMNRNGRFLARANEAVLPFYILHHPVILLVGVYAVGWPVGVATKFAVIAGTSLVITLAVYELLIRRLNPVRYLFGMKPRTRAGNRVRPAAGIGSDPIAGRDGFPDGQEAKV